MAANLTFQKALLQLDRGLLEAGEKNLLKAINEAEKESDSRTLIGALCCLGDFLVSEGRDAEAVSSLRRVLAFEREDDLFDYEQGRAQELLDAMDPQL